MTSDKKLFYIAGVLIIISLIYYGMKRYDSRVEGYSPYRNTGGCGDGDGNYNYLRQYHNQQFYLEDPNVYPTSDNYFKALIKNKVVETNFVRNQRYDIEAKYG